MIARWLGNLRWILMLAIVAGPGFAYFSYTELQTQKRVMAEGVETTAVVDGAESRSRRRSGTTTYKIHAVWTEQSGAQRAEDISISSSYAEKIIQGDFLVIDSVVIKYLPGEPDVSPLVVEDAAEQIESSELMMYLGGGAGIIGVIGSALFLLFGRKKQQPAGVPA